MSQEFDKGVHDDAELARAACNCVGCVPHLSAGPAHECRFEAIFRVLREERYVAASAPRVDWTGLLKATAEPDGMATCTWCNCPMTCKMPPVHPKWMQKPICRKCYEEVCDGIPGAPSPPWDTLPLVDGGDET